MHLKASDISYRFAAQQSDGSDRPETAIEVAAIDASPGELVILAGPSGSGKTTLLQLLGGLLTPQGGTINWDGVNIGALNESGRDHWRRRNAGLVFQNFFLIEGMSALRNVIMPSYFTRLVAGPDTGRARDLLDQFGVPDIDRQVQTFSRGEQQRIAIARALLFDPPVILADEPTASLDKQSARQVTDTLSGLAEQQGKTVIAVTHDAELIDRASRTYTMEHGRLLPQPVRESVA